MKNKQTFFLAIFFIFIPFFENLSSDEFNFESPEIEIFEKGNKIKAINGAKITTKDGIEITSDQFSYDKLKLELIANGNVKFIDKINKIILDTNKLIYLRGEDKILSEKETFINVDNKYEIESSNVVYDRKLMKISSNKKTVLYDDFNNSLSSKDLQFFVLKKTIKAKKINFVDNQKNKFFFENALIDLKNQKILAKDLSVNFNNLTFGNKKNEPRLKGNVLNMDNNNIKVSKGVFTTCKKKNDGCPPWELQAEEINHDKAKQTIYYKNAWLKVYNQPVLYFPKFFHPDPTVKRQSGFLIPRIYNSNILSSSVKIPYFHVISESKDLTIQPRIFSNKNLTLQSEYRQANKNSFHIVDFSVHNKLNPNNKHNTKTHLFANSIIDIESNIFDASNIELNLQKVSNDSYLKAYKLKSPLIDNESTLHSFVTYSSFKDDLSIETSVEIFEDLSKNQSDRYEYVYPNYNIVKNIETNANLNGDLNLEITGYQKKWNTNEYSFFSINNLFYNSNPIIFGNSLKSNYDLMLKNVNSKEENLSGEKERTSLLADLKFQTSLPMKKKGTLYDRYLTPLVSLRYSPNETKNLKDEDRRIDINNIFSFNRIASNTSVEGGQSITLGTQYKLTNKKNNNEIINFDLATVYRDEKNEDLPSKSTIGEKSSDIVGKLSLKPNNFFNINYNFSLDNSMKTSNYDSIKTSFNVNNFVTSFEFLEEKNIIGNESYWGNETNYNFNSDNAISFKTRKNRKTNLTEFYNLIYQYKNDCLVAALEYNKEYYEDRDLKPEEQIFFSITIMPFGKSNSPNLKSD